MPNLTNKQVKHLNRMLDSVENIMDPEKYNNAASSLISIFFRVRKHINKKTAKRKRRHMK